MKRSHALMLGLSIAVGGSVVALVSSDEREPAESRASNVYAPTPSSSVVDSSDPVVSIAGEKTLAGIVRSASGDRLARVAVSLLKANRPMGGTETNALGEFFMTAPAGEYVVQATHPGFASASVYTVAPSTDIQIALFPGNSVAGVVVHEFSAKPAPFARVRAAAHRSGFLQPVAVQSNEHGEFRFKDLPAGEWLLTVDGPEVYGALPEPISVTLDEALSDIRIVVRAAATVAGRFIIGEDDRPCPSGTMQFIPPLTSRPSDIDVRSRVLSIPLERRSANEAATRVVRVESDGRFQVDALAYGNYLLYARCDEHQSINAHTVLTVGETPIPELRFKFTEGLRVVAKVRDAANRPVPRAEVLMASATESALSAERAGLARRRGLTDEYGAYRFGGLSPGTYRVTARYTAINGSGSDEQLITLVDGDDVEVADLTLPGAAAIRVRVHTQNGEGVSRLFLFALDSMQTRYEGRYLGDGRFVIGPVPLGSFRVFAYDNKNSKLQIGGSAPIDIRDDRGVDIDFPYSQPSGTLEGRVVHANGAPISGALVRAVSTALDEIDERFSFIQVGAHGPQELLTDRNGKFRIEGLDTQGSYDLHVDHRNGVREVRRNVQASTFVEVVVPTSGTPTGGNEPEGEAESSAGATG